MNVSNELGGGLVEISAVATLIGAPIAEALVHGYKAACGLAWAPMSFFGIIHVTKACLSAAVPDWLRESLGLRNEFVDKAVGIMLPVNSAKDARGRIDLGDACAIEVDSIQSSSEERVDDEGGLTGTTTVANDGNDVFSSTLDELQDRSGMSVYVMDNSGQMVLNTVPSGRGIPTINRFTADDDGAPAKWKDWLVLLCSVIKLLEAFCLWRMGSNFLHYWTTVGWAHAFIAAFLLQSLGLGRDNLRNGTRDILVGDLPSPLHAGGDGKLVLGMPANVRRHFVWKSVLALGVLFYITELFGIFLDLTTEPSIVVYVWIGFQVLWLITRTVVHYFVEGAAAARQGVIVSQTWEASSRTDQWRSLAILEELSKHQISIHPRHVRAYHQDCLSFRGLACFFAHTRWTLTYDLPLEKFLNNNTGHLRSLDIKAVVGDTMIRSATWYAHAQLDSSCLYDAAVIFLLTSEDASPTAVPTIRARACDCGTSPRGNSHPRDCMQDEWCYFIPSRAADDGDANWIYAHGKVGVGLLTAEALSAEELDRRFKVGRWKLSIRSVEELKEGLEVIREAARVMMSLIKGPAASEALIGGERDGKKDEEKKGPKEVVYPLEAV